MSAEYIHRYSVDGHTFYLLSGQARPGATVRINPKNWTGRVQAQASILNQLNGLDFKGEDPKKEEEAKEEAKEQKNVKAFVADLDHIATELEVEGHGEIALAVDRISDALEG